MALYCSHVQSVALLTLMSKTYVRFDVRLIYIYKAYQYQLLSDSFHILMSAAQKEQWT